jgi:hypothetical protein
MTDDPAVVCAAVLAATRSVAHDERMVPSVALQTTTTQAT